MNKIIIQSKTLIKPAYKIIPNEYGQYRNGDACG
jgi:hypothetical protein